MKFNQKIDSSSIKINELLLALIIIAVFVNFVKMIDGNKTIDSYKNLTSKVDNATGTERKQVMQLLNIPVVPSSDVQLQDQHLPVSDIDLKQLEKGWVGCQSHSMKPTLDCGDTLLTEDVSPYEPLQVGSIYLYKYNASMNIVHRYMGCIDQFCKTLIFEGDGNYGFDLPVDRSQVYKKVVGVIYG